MGLAKVLETLNYRERAEDAYRKAIAINPGYYEAKIELARILCDFGKHAESIALLQSALADDPSNDRAGAEIAVNELKRGNAAAAIPLLERYLARTGPTAWTYENLGRAHADAGNATTAEEHYRRALALNPLSELANLWCGQLLVATGRRADADAHFRRFRELHAYQVEAREVEQAIARRPDDAEKLIGFLVRLAELRARQGKHEESLVPLKRALGIRPDDQALAKLYESQAQRAAAGTQR
jgi:tetratricopeptide (TPR) repeat protein